MNVKGYGGTLPALPGEAEEYYERNSDNQWPWPKFELETS
jgi:hypothetical protein